MMQESARIDHLDLLRGPSDEQRLVGLYLTAKTLNSGDNDTLQQVYDTIGPQFLQRLLRPLLRSTGDFEAEDSGRQKIALAALGLSIIAALCRNPSLAATKELFGLLPVLLKVVKEGGVSCITSSSLTADHAVASADEQAVQDCLESATLMAESSQEARDLALKSSGLGVVAVALTSQSTSKQWVLRCLMALLQGCQKLDSQTASVELIPSLSHMLAATTRQAASKGGKNEAANASKGSTASSTSTKSAAAQRSASSDQGTNGQHRQNESRAQDQVETDGIQREEDNSAPQTEPSLNKGAREEGKIGDQSRESSNGSENVDRQRGDLGLDASSQSLMILSALTQILPLEQGSKEETLLRDSCTLSSACWCLAARQGLMILLQSRLPPNEKQAALKLVAFFIQLTPAEWILSDGSGAFFSVVVQLLRVEITLLLQDALAGSSSLSTTPQSSEATPQKGSDSSRAALRADASLPPLLQLFEACTDALAFSSESEDSGEPEKGNTLPESVAGKAMGSLMEVAEALLQYLEQLQQEKQDTDLSLVAIKALGRFLAEAPDLEPKRIRAIMPWIVTNLSGAGIPYLLPLLGQMMDHRAEAKTRDLWAAACLRSKVLPHLCRAIQEICGSSVETDKWEHNLSALGKSSSMADTTAVLYDICLVLVWLIDHLAEMSHDDNLPVDGQDDLIQAASCCAIWVRNCLQPLQGTAEQGSQILTSMGASAQSSPIPGTDFGFSSRHSALKATDIDPRLLAYMGHICAYALLCQTQKGETGRAEGASECLTCALSALEVSDVILTLPLEPADPAPTRLLAELLKINGQQPSQELQQAPPGGLGPSPHIPLEHEEASEHEEIVAEIEPQAVRTLHLIKIVLSNNLTLQKDAKSTAWWKQMSSLDLSDVECQKSAYLRALRPVLML